MIPTDPQEREALAGEYVLGTLDARLAEEVAAALPSNIALREVVAAWEARLAPLRARADRRNWAGIAAEIKKRVPRDPHSKHSDVLEETSKK